MASEEIADQLRSLLQGIDIEVIARAELLGFREAVSHLTIQVDTIGQTERSDRSAPPEEDALSGRGVNAQRMQRFAEAAKAFYEATPWQILSVGDLIRVESPKPPDDMRYASVVGRPGQDFGINFYQRMDDIDSVRDEHFDFIQDRKFGLWSILFDELDELPGGDAGLWQSFDWPRANENAYPSMIAYHPQLGIKRATSKRLAFAEGLMAALARTTEAQADRGRWDVEVVTADGPTTYTLTLPNLLEELAADETGVLSRSGWQVFFDSLERQAEAARNRGEHATVVTLMDDAIRQAKTGPTDVSNETKAKELLHNARFAEGRRRVQLAREALTLDPDCCEAYLLLGQSTTDPVKGAELLTEAVAAGQRKLGPTYFEQHVGDFWSLVETRPYMRARFELAMCLIAGRRPKEAVAHLAEILRLDANDHQGARFRYVGFQMTLNRDRQAMEFIDSYEDDSTTWRFLRAICLFRLEGKTRASRDALLDAHAANPHVAVALHEGREAFDQHVDAYAPGTVDEAVFCLNTLAIVMVVTEGGIDFLKSARTRIRASGSRKGKRLKRVSRRR